MTKEIEIPEMPERLLALIGPHLRRNERKAFAVIAEHTERWRLPLQHLGPFRLGLLLKELKAMPDETTEQEAAASLLASAISATEKGHGKRRGPYERRRANPAQAG